MLGVFVEDLLSFRDELDRSVLRVENLLNRKACLGYSKTNAGLLKIYKYYFRQSFSL